MPTQFQFATTQDLTRRIPSGSGMRGYDLDLNLNGYWNAEDLTAKK
jgi:hypothetical protein